MSEADTANEKSRLISGNGANNTSKTDHDTKSGNKSKYVRSQRRTYLFGQRGASEGSIIGEDDTELSELRTRFGKTPDEDDNIKVIQRPIQPEDSLRSFALQYGCTVADLKRLNNLYTDAGFYALKNIKIPIKKYGVLAEAEEELTRKQTNVSAASNSQSGLTETDINEGDLASQEERADKFFKDKDQEVEKLKEATQNVLKKDDEDDAESPLILGGPPAAKKEDKKAMGIDCGLNWIGVLIIVIIIGIIAPILYYLYYTYFSNGNNDKEDHGSVTTPFPH